jgi:hypothetical protein
MSADVIPINIKKHDYLWDRIIQPDLSAFLAGRGRNMCDANIGRALGLGLFNQIANIRGCWAEAERVKALRAAERQQQKANAQ